MVPAMTSAMRQLQFDGYRFAYRESGSGPDVILAHCSGGNHRQWHRLCEQLSPRYRVRAPDFMGYGDSNQDADTPEPRSMNPDLQLILSLMNDSRGPMHLVGHSYGGAVCLQAALHQPNRIASLVLIEPVSFHYLRAIGAETWRDVDVLARRVMQLAARGKYTAAARAFIGFWHNPFAWWVLPRAVRKSMEQAIPKIAQELASIYQLDADTQSLHRFVKPVLLLQGAKTKAPARRVCALLNEALPDTTLQIIAGAGHMSPITHTDEVNRLIADWLDGKRT